MNPVRKFVYKVKGNNSFGFPLSNGAGTQRKKYLLNLGDFVPWW